jgi:tyrosyl-tRNA synthetase
VLLARLELRDLRRDGRQQPEGERRQAQDAEGEEEGEKSELADAPPLARARLFPEQRQCGGSLARHMAHELVSRAVDVLPEGELERKLRLGRPLRVKLGVDPTSPDVHLGFAYVLDRLADFQRAGHVIVLIVGDYTARIGDPSGLSKERPVLDDDVLDANAQYFAEQAFRILDPDKTEVRFNGEWLGALSYADTVRLARTMTVARLLERDDFAKRFAGHVPISLSELLYPVMQAYDSVAIEADIEIGGTDQRFNLLAGRDVMPEYGLEPQVVVTYPLLVGLDGELKMSKSRGNYIGITEPPEEMFGKTMSISDELLPHWWEMLVDEPDHPSDPLEWKLELARRITARWHGPEGAARGEEHFTRVVRHHEVPEEVPEVALPDSDPVHLPALLVDWLGVASTSAARRLIAQGGVKVNGEPPAALDLPREALAGALVQVGKRRFARLTPG